LYKVLLTESGILAWLFLLLSFILSLIWFSYYLLSDAFFFSMSNCLYFLRLRFISLFLRSLMLKLHSPNNSFLVLILSSFFNSLSELKLWLIGSFSSYSDTDEMLSSTDNELDEKELLMAESCTSMWNTFKSFTEFNVLFWQTVSSLFLALSTFLRNLSLSFLYDPSLLSMFMSIDYSDLRCVFRRFLLTLLSSFCFLSSYLLSIYFLRAWDEKPKLLPSLFMSYFFCAEEEDDNELFS